MSKPAVLFVCVKNGGKSQLAAGLLRQKLGEAVEVYSAGTEPGQSIPAQVVEVLEEVGASTEGEYPKPLETKIRQRVDLTVVLGGDAHVAPIVGMSGPIETWQVDEPSERGVEGLERLRLVRDDIDRQVSALADDLRAVADLPEGREAGHVPPPGQPPICID